jgi:dolichol-phosphate mannosyltransferase
MTSPQGQDPEGAPVVSVVLPMFDEEAAAPRALAAVVGVLDALREPFEIVCVDDGSRDGTLNTVTAAAARDPRIRVVALARNFGKEAALMAGLGAARGRAVVLMDADLQHPPEVIPAMLDLWRQGHEVVHGRKRRRAREPLSYRVLARLFNRLMGQAAGVDFAGASDFKLLDRIVVDALLQFPERNRFFRALVSWSGFRGADVPFDVAERVAGETKWSLRGLVTYSLNNLVAFSSLPLRLTAWLGVFAFAMGILLAPWTLYRYLRGDAVTGFTTVILLQLIIGGALMTGIGVLSLYLAEIFQEVKRRPLYLARPAQKRNEPAAPAAKDHP